MLPTIIAPTKIIAIFPISLLNMAITLSFLVKRSGSFATVAVFTENNLPGMYNIVSNVALNGM